MDQPPNTTPSPPAPRARHARRAERKSRRTLLIGLGVVVVAAGVAGVVVATHHSGAAPVATSTATTGVAAAAPSTSAPPTTAAPTTTAPPTTTTTAPVGATPTTVVPVGPTTSPPLPAPGPGFVADHVTAVGDSVMLDYQPDLQQDIAGIDVQAAVSRQWGVGEQVLAQLKASGQLGGVVVVGLGTNGPITVEDFDSMMSILSGASRVVFVTVHVDQPWQDPNNAVLAAGVARYPNAYLADWASLADQNPGWLYSDGTHLPIGGPGAQALAALIAGYV